MKSKILIENILINKCSDEMTMATINELLFSKKLKAPNIDQMLFEMSIKSDNKEILKIYSRYTSF